jgi:hypothetical protein
MNENLRERARAAWKEKKAILAEEKRQAMKRFYTNTQASICKVTSSVY